MSAETGKQLRSSGSSSDESDRVKDEGAGSTTRRSFECTYCKRGFTNAQALGGHMNIHRKDRAKDKIATAVTKNTNSYSDDLASYMTNYRQIAPSISSRETDSTGFGNLDAQRAMVNSLHMYRPSAMSESLINRPRGGGHNPNPIRPSQEMGSNLSLWVGASASNYVAWDNIIQEDSHEEDNNEDVDLELRLGPK